MSASQLKNLSRSPAYFKYKQENPTEETDAMALGSAVHCAILEPKKFLTDYIKAPICDKRTKEGKEIYAKFLDESEGKKVLSDSDYTQAIDISNSVLSSPKIKSMIENGECEKEILFNIDGVDFKSKLDFLNDKFILDIKTTRDARAESFSRDCYNMLYHVQMWIYQEAAFALTGKRLPVVILAIEKTDNYDYCVYNIDSTWLELGERKARKLIQLYKDCVEKNEWLGYKKEVQVLEIPNWAKAE